MMLIRYNETEKQKNMSEIPTYNQINEQTRSAYMNRSDANPTVLVKRTDGRVTVGRLDKDIKNVHFSEEGKDWVRSATMESLSDDRQAHLAEELAGRALLGSGLEGGVDISTPTAQEQEPSIDPFEQLPESVKEDVRDYRRAVRNKRESERDKDFAQAAEDGRAIYRVEQALSPEAKQFLGLS